MNRIHFSFLQRYVNISYSLTQYFHNTMVTAFKTNDFDDGPFYIGMKIRIVNFKYPCAWNVRNFYFLRVRQSSYALVLFEKKKAILHREKEKIIIRSAKSLSTETPDCLRQAHASFSGTWQILHSCSFTTPLTIRFIWKLFTARP